MRRSALRNDDVRLFGAEFSAEPARRVLERVQARGDGGGPRLIVTANLDHVIELSANAQFRRAYTGAAARTLDGMPLVWAARLCGMREVARVTGHDLLDAVLTQPPAPGCRVFLVCATASVAARMTGRFCEAGLAPDAVRTAVPPLGFERDTAYSEGLARAVREHGTTLLVLGVGAPKSEIWVHRHGRALGAPVCLAIGEALNVAAGAVPRAPVLMQRLGLEWLFRFAHAPRRLFTRYFVRSWRVLGLATTRRGRTMLSPSHNTAD